MTLSSSQSATSQRPWPPDGVDWYYSDNHTAIACADCRDILPELEPADLVLTDPPYGIADKWKGGSKHGWAKSATEAVVRNLWDETTPDPGTLNAVVNAGKTAIIWGGNYFSEVLPRSRCWLVWNKPERGFTLAEAELAWTNADNVVRVFDGPRSDPGRFHPTQKPLSLMLWCLSLSWAKKSETVIDPFMGSGTTMLAAKEFGKRAIGIEAHEQYCEKAAKRLSQEVLPL
jgi:DNA modification methylase